MLLTARGWFRGVIGTLAGRASVLPGRIGLVRVPTGRRESPYSPKARLAAVLADQHRLEALLEEAKRRKGVPSHKLAFVGIHNLARVWYCGMQAVLASRQEEIAYFAAVLEDRIVYSDLLGRVAPETADDTDLLSVGVALELEDLEELFPACSLPRRPSNRPTTPRTFERVSIDTGLALQLKYGESYPTFRWNFSCGPYTAVGIPDGLTKHFVYEFKSKRTERYRDAFIEIPLAQADLYGLCFHRPRKRVQVLYADACSIDTIDSDVDAVRALSTLHRFATIDAGVCAGTSRTGQMQGM